MGKRRIKAAKVGIGAASMLQPVIRARYLTIDNMQRGAEEVRGGQGRKRRGMKVPDAFIGKYAGFAACLPACRMQPDEMIEKRVEIARVDKLDNAGPPR